MRSKKWVAILSATVLALVGAVGTIREMRWNRHDLEVVDIDETPTDSKLAYRILKSQSGCRFDIQANISVNPDNKSPAVHAQVGETQLLVDSKFDPSSGVLIIALVDEKDNEQSGISDTPGWVWPAVSDLNIRINGPVKEMVLEDWSLRCENGTDTLSASMGRDTLLWISVLLCILGTFGAVFGAWISGEKKLEQPQTDPLQAVINEIFIADLSDDHLDLLKDVIRMAMRNVSLEDLRSLICKVGDGSSSRGMMYFRQGIAQVKASCRELSMSAAVAHRKGKSAKLVTGNNAIVGGDEGAQ